MQIKAIELLQANQVLGQVGNLDVSYKLSYKIARIHKDVIREVKTLNEQRQKIVEKYAKKDAKGKLVIKVNKYEFAKGDEQKTNEEVAKFYEDTEVKLDTWLIEEDELINEPNLKIKANQLRMIDFLIEKKPEVKGK